MVKAIMKTPLGDMIATSDGVSLTGLWFEGQAHIPKVLPEETAPDLAVFIQTQRWLNAYFAKETLPPMPKLNPEGTGFQKAVWQQLLLIPYGQTTTYGALARGVGRPKASQAVGGAVGRNPISIVVACHRVIGRNGSLTGYAGGLDRKIALLALEKIE